MKKEKKGEPKGSPKKYDYTSTKRGQKRTALDNAWAEMVSGGKYKTLRNLMRANPCVQLTGRVVWLGL